MALLCINCLKDCDKTLTCDTCEKRFYCSLECKNTDLLVHKDWCGFTGELGYDYEIRKTPNKGFGVFALKDFKKNDKIMIEKVALAIKREKHNGIHVPTLLNNFIKITSKAMQNEIIKLYTLPGLNDLPDIIISALNYNAMALSNEYNDYNGICIYMSRINNSCDENASHTFINNPSKKYPFVGFKLLIASRDIKAGDEITIAYADIINHKNSIDRRQHLYDNYGFWCDCKYCPNKDVAGIKKEAYNKGYDMLKLYDDKIAEYALGGYHKKSIAAGKKQLELYDALDMSSIVYSRTYYDLFQVSITSRDTLDDYNYYLDQAIKYRIAYMAPFEKFDDGIESYRKLKHDPSKHQNYLSEENPIVQLVRKFAKQGV